MGGLKSKASKGFARVEVLFRAVQLALKPTRAQDNEYQSAAIRTTRLGSLNTHTYIYMYTQTHIRHIHI